MHEWLEKINRKWDEISQVEHVVMKKMNERMPFIKVNQEVIHSYQLKLRMAQKKDIQAIVELEQLAYEGYIAWREKDFEREWKRNPYLLYLVLDHFDEGIVGAITGRVNAKNAHISHLIIDPYYHRKGLGNYLLETWIELMHETQVPKITLEVRSSNIPAINLYKKQGFKVIDTKQNYYDDDNPVKDAYYMSYDFLEEKNEI